jgi:hypothetical protein
VIIVENDAFFKKPTTKFENAYVLRLCQGCIRKIYEFAVHLEELVFFSEKTLVLRREKSCDSLGLIVSKVLWRLYTHVPKKSVQRLRCVRRVKIRGSVFLVYVIIGLLFKSIKKSGDKYLFVDV